MKSKGKLGIALIAIIVFTALFVAIVLFNSPSRKVRKQFELGEKYLTELNYEQAVAMFTEVIKIDSDNEEAIQGLVAAYVAWADDALKNSNYDMALEMPYF